MQLTILTDNLAGGELHAEHGLSVLVENGAESLLFDTGQSSIWLENARKLGKDTGKIRKVAISHGHYDHTGGLLAAAVECPDLQVYAHPGCFHRRFLQNGSNLRDIGAPPEITSALPDIHWNESVREIMDGVLLSGVIPLKTPAELPADGRFLKDAGQGPEVDDFEDEQCLVVRGDSGIAVIAGCSHRGIENTVLAAMSAAGTDHINLLVGGMHLLDAGESRLTEIAEFLWQAKIDRIICCHCTGESAASFLISRLGERVAVGSAGDRWLV